MDPASGVRTSVCLLFLDWKTSILITDLSICRNTGFARYNIHAGIYGTAGKSGKIAVFCINAYICYEKKIHMV